MEHSKFTKELEGLSEDKVRKYLEEKVKDLPIQVIELAVREIKKIADDKFLASVIVSKLELKNRWFLPFHFAFGKRFRMMLNDLVLRSEDLPEKSWEFYYVQLIEMALGLW